MEAISHTNPKLKLPLRGKLADREIADVKTWIDVGAPWPEEAVAAAPTLPGRKQLTGEQLDFWSFRPLQTPVPPAVRDDAWAKNAIDCFVLAKFELQGLRPVEPAPKQALIRRAAQEAKYTQLERERNAFLADQTRQLCEILANKTARYMEAAWPVLQGDQSNVDHWPPGASSTVKPSRDGLPICRKPSARIRT